MKSVMMLVGIALFGLEGCATVYNFCLPSPHPNQPCMPQKIVTYQKYNQVKASYIKDEGVRIDLKGLQDNPLAEAITEAIKRIPVVPTIDSGE